MSGSVEHLAMFFSTGECWRCRAIYDSRASWSWSRLDEWGKKSLKLLLLGVTCPLFLFIQSSHFRWSRKEPNFCLACYLISELNHDLFSQSTWFWILAFNAIYLCPIVSSIEHIDINDVWNRWTGKHFLELFSKEEKQRQLKKLLVKTAKWVMRLTSLTSHFGHLSKLLQIFWSFDSEIALILGKTSWTAL